MEGPSTFFHYREGYWMPNNAVHRVQWGKGRDLDVADRYPRWLFIIGSAGGALIFGIPHLFAWNFAFPTDTEKLLWRIAASATVGLPVVGAIADSLISLIYKQRARRASRERPEEFQTRFLNNIAIVIWLFALPYLVARIYIIVEVFRSLCFLPPDAFVTTWASSVPHVG